MLYWKQAFDKIDQLRKLNIPGVKKPKAIENNRVDGIQGPRMNQASRMNQGWNAQLMDDHCISDYQWIPSGYVKIAI